MFNRIRSAWKISKTPGVDVIQMVEDKQKHLDLLKDAIEQNQVLLGDGNAVFFGEPDEKDQLEYEREQEGTTAWYNRLKNLI